MSSFDYFMRVIQIWSSALFVITTFSPHPNAQGKREEREGNLLGCISFPMLEVESHEIVARNKGNLCDMFGIAYYR